MLLLGVSDPKGVCYVETKNLDGETNLKIKNVPKDINNEFSTLDKLLNIDGVLLCERPNGALYKFEGHANFS
jgi:magnesium-transporting ATPase (P-type)